jgi:ferrous iron transport protein A
MYLHQLKKGSTAKITKFDNCDFHYKQKLIAMGLIPGAKLSISNISPLCDLIELTVGNIVLALRKTEANIVRVVPIS